MIVEFFGEHNIHIIEVEPRDIKIERGAFGGDCRGVPYTKVDVDIEYEVDAWLCHGGKSRKIDIGKVNGYDDEIDDMHNCIRQDIFDGVNF